MDLETKGGISVASVCIPIVNGISIITSLELGLALLKGTAPSYLGQTTTLNMTFACLHQQATLKLTTHI